MLLRVAKALLSRHPDVTFQWLMHPDFKPGGELAQLIPPERFELVKSYSAEELRGLYSESWAFFMPYDNVTASHSIVECMACGTPVFTTRVGGMESYGAQAMTLSENNDDFTMLAALERCLASRSIREELGSLARRHAVENFTWQKVVASHLKFYSEVYHCQTVDS